MKFDLTKNVRLEPVWQKRYAFARWLLWLIFLLVIVYLGLIIFLPSENFSLQFPGKNAKAGKINNITVSNNPLLIESFSKENFSTAKISLVSAAPGANLAGQAIAVRKTYKAFAYPTADQPVSSPYQPSSETPGFADGTLLSFDISVFAVVQGKIMPFNNPDTFLSFGYDWSSVIPATEEEIGLYSRDKLFTIDRPHPDGTVFKTIENGKYYLVKDGQKWPIEDPEILKSYLRGQPILASEKSLEFQNSCKLKKDIWPLNSFSCEISIENLRESIGNDYQFFIDSPANNTLDKVSILFSRSFTWPNMRDTLSDIKRRFLINFGYAPVQ